MTVPPGVSLFFDPDNDETAFADPAADTDSDTENWNRIDNYPGVHINHIQITRGRTDERSKTSPGTVTISGMDENGVLDPTNENGPFFGNLDPVKQAAVSMWNPATQEWNWLFRGYVSDITLSFDSDVSKPFLDFQITFVDMLDMLNDAEIIPDSQQNSIPGENVGDSYYTGQHCDDRLFAVLADAATIMYGNAGWGGWPVTMLQIASGNVFVQGKAYPNQSSLLQVIDDACDAEGPYSTNRFITKDGSFAFRGRYYRYVPEFFQASSDADRRLNHRLVKWSVADQQNWVSGQGMGSIAGLTFTRGKTNLINGALVTPAGIRNDAIPGKEIHDAASIQKYGPRTSGSSLEGLIIIKGDDGNNYIDEAQSYARAMVDNYKNPVTRVSKLKMTNPPDDTDEMGANTWAVLSGVELSDIVTITTDHPGGGGFTLSDHFVEQITYDIQPLDGDIWQVEMTLDLTPRAYYGSMPNSWKPPIVGGLNADFGFSVAGLQVTFTDTSTAGPSGPITAWLWDFGDGTTSTSQNPVHTYASVGLYGVELTVTGTSPDGTSTTFAGVIIVDTTLNANFTFTQQ